MEKVIFVQRNILQKLGGKLIHSKISITNPVASNENYFECFIKFSDAPKYNTNVKGVDEFHCLECALIYIDSICKNSEKPEFFNIYRQSLKTPN